MEQESALLYMMVQTVQGSEKIKLEGFQSGGHNAQPNRLKCLGLGEVLLPCNHALVSLEGQLYS